MKGALATLLTATALAAAAPVTAHHSFAAEYDAMKPVTLTGRVTRIELTNPHAHMFVDVKDDNGTMTRWTIELASPKVLAQYGWRTGALKVGDDVSVEGAMAKDGSTSANARIVTLADGRRLYAGSSGGDLPPQH